MDKLREYLMEYEPYIQSDGTPTDNFWLYVWQGYSAIFPRELGENKIISKRYGFIKWLVDNEKIDRDKDRYGINFFENGSERFLKSEEELIMELSIQDEPIKFLISVLK